MLRQQDTIEAQWRRRRHCRRAGGYQRARQQLTNGRRLSIMGARSPMPDECKESDWCVDGRRARVGDCGCKCSNSDGLR
jgi:hypothetical protein